MLLIVQLPRAVLSAFAPSTEILISLDMNGALASFLFVCLGSLADSNMHGGVVTTEQVELLYRKMQMRFQLRICFQNNSRSKLCFIINFSKKVK